MITTINEKTLETCLLIANKLIHPEHVQAISLSKENFIPFIQAYPWNSSTLSHGYAAFIILFSEMDNHFPGQGWDLIGHRYMVHLLKEIEENGTYNSSLFSGLTGLCFAIHLASKQGKRYQTLLTKLHPILIKRIENEYLLPIEQAMRAHQFLSPLHYDVIVGVSGILNYILEYSHLKPMHALACSLVRILVNLKSPVLYKNFSLPGWYIPQDYLLINEQRTQYPEGCFDTGLAHGVAGCIAALSKAYLNGVVVDHQQEAIEEMVSWLQKNKLKSHKWPAKFAFNSKFKNYLEEQPEFYRDGWCYGAPGIASAIFLASQALNKSNLRQEAIQIMTAVCKRFDQDRNLDCVSFCHGFAGLLTMVHAMYSELTH
jgi:lantibiotic modifying enzyme